MALLAVRTQAALVLIFVATGAAGRQAEVGPARILDLDGRTFLRRDVGGLWHLLQVTARVLAFEQVSRLFVIEGLDVPLDQRKVFAVVLRVAAGAFLAGAGGNVVGRVQTLACRKPGRDFGVAVQTLQRRLPAKLVATGAVGGSVERLVRPRQWSRRDLRPAGRQQHEETKCGNHNDNRTRLPACEHSFHLRDMSWRERSQLGLTLRLTDREIRAASLLPAAIII